MAQDNRFDVIASGSLLGLAYGSIYENFVACALKQKGYDLHYYKPDDNSELEFIIEKNVEIEPFEVKEGNTATVSLDRFIEKFKPTEAYKIAGSNVGQSSEMLTIPHYMVMFILQNRLYKQLFIFPQMIYYFLDMNEKYLQ